MIRTDISQKKIQKWPLSTSKDTPTSLVISEIQMKTKRILLHTYWNCLIYLFFLTSLLEYNCFTMICQFLLYNKVNQLYAYVYPHIPSLLSLPPTLPYPTPLGGHKAPSRSPCAMRLLPTSYLFYVWQCIYVHVTLSLCPSLSLPSPYPQVHSLVGLSLFPSCHQVLHGLFFFFSPQIPYICVSILYLFFSF